jgi:serine phosphatase RsbU (regulator of sigma subunit)
MDVGILVFKNEEVYFSGANSPLFYTSENKIHQIKGSRFPIGSNHYSSSKQFQLHKIDPSKGDRFFLFSDGFQDQLGGPNDKKYLTKCFREFVDDSSALPLDEQGDAIVEEFLQWKGDEEQTDDVLIIGLEL